MRNFRFLYLFLLAFVMLAIPASTPAQVAIGVSIRVGPPAIPVYAQPICPGAGYMWTPGYWAYGDDGYYWVPGTWVLAPQPGLLWTPGYWGWGSGVYLWHAGYWGPHVGFYGGVNYGFGYGGVGFVGGEWRGGTFFYNRSVMNINVNIIHNTYNRTVVVRNSSRVSFNGGPGGINARPDRQEMAAAHEHHIAATNDQMQHAHAASLNRSEYASENHGRPSVAATARPGDFRGNGAVRANRAGRNANRPTANRNFRNTNSGGKNRQPRQNAARPAHNNPKPQHQSKAKPPRKPDDRPHDR